MENTIDKKFVSEDGFDLCVMCSTKTQYKTETHVDAREHYVEGAGQLCKPCFTTTYGKEGESK